MYRVTFPVEDGCVLSFPADPDDYTALSQNITLDNVNTSVHLVVYIYDDNLCEPDEKFYIVLTSLNDNCYITSSPVPVYIIDDDGKLPAY